MSVATDLQTIAANVPLVYAAGQRDASDLFWNEVQQNGNRTNYQYGFAGDSFTDDLMPPKYALPTFSSNNTARFMFYYNHKLTEINFALSFSATTNSNVFAYANALVTISYLTVTSAVTFSGWFTGCTALKNLTMYGTIGQTLDLSPCTQLTAASGLSVLGILSTNGGGTLTFSASSPVKTEYDNTGSAVYNAVIAARGNGWTVNFS